MSHFDKQQNLSVRPFSLQRKQGTLGFVLFNANVRTASSAPLQPSTGFGRRFDELLRTAQTVGEEQIGGAPMAPLQWRHLYIYALVDLGRDKHKGNILRILQRNRFTRATVEVYPIHTSPHTTNLRKPSTRGPRVCVNLTQFMAHPLCKVLKA